MSAFVKYLKLVRILSSTLITVVNCTQKDAAATANEKKNAIVKRNKSKDAPEEISKLVCECFACIVAVNHRCRYPCVIVDIMRTCKVIFIYQMGAI